MPNPSELPRLHAALADASDADHLRAAEAIADIARSAIALAGERSRTDDPLSEHALTAWIMQAFERMGLETVWSPSVSCGARGMRPSISCSRDSLPERR